MQRDWLQDLKATVYPIIGQQVSGFRLTDLVLDNLGPDTGKATYVQVTLFPGSPHQRVSVFAISYWEYGERMELSRQIVAYAVDCAVTRQRAI